MPFLYPNEPHMTPSRFLGPLFFLSGFPALLYQVVWQRSLFSLFGTNVESVTVVVAAFMLGLGLGSCLLYTSPSPRD